MSFIKTIQTRAQAGKTAIKGAGEMYNCNAAIADHGLQAVIGQRATNLERAHPSLSQSDAMMLASREVGMLQSIANGDKPFSEVRKQLDTRAQEKAPTPPHAQGMNPATSCK